MEIIGDEIKNKLPMGSNKSEVLEFLKAYKFDSLKFDIGEYVTETEAIDFLINNSTHKKPKKLEGRLKGYLAAAIYNVYKQPSGHSSIIVSFYFDTDEKLIDYEITRKGEV